MKWLNGIVIFGTFALLTFFEKKKPLRKQIEPKLLNASRDLAIASTAAIASYFLEKPVTDKLTKFVENKKFRIVKNYQTAEIFRNCSRGCFARLHALSVARYNSQTTVFMAFS